MAKKYLLYIHFEEFSNEPHKSALVNELLSNHYAKGDLTGGNPHVPKGDPIPTNCAGHTMRWDCGKQGCKYA